jgi:rRNA maturation RNase YbeY
MAKALATVSVKNFTRQRVPRLPFAEVASSRLPGWEISLVFAGEARAQSLNQRLRNKSYTPNVLSYVVGEKSGEIIICAAVAAHEAPDYTHTFAEHVLYLFIHGVLHLEGRAHGATMEKWEQTLLTRFAGASLRTLPHESAHRDRH